MPTYNTHIARTTAGSDPLVPEPLAATIIQELPKASAALSVMARTTLSAKTQRMPVLDVLPIAYWVSGDAGLKQTTTQGWKNIVMVVEELACIVPIPLAYLDDADVPIWSEVQPRITEAVGALIDSAVLWGVNKPTTWGEAVFPGATKSGHWVTEGTGVDLGQDVSNLGLAMAATGYTVNGFVAMPGISWKLAGLRSAQGVPIYQPNMQASPGGTLYGYQLSEIQNGSWINPTTGALMLAGDFTKSIIGIRSDISFKMFDQGVISDGSGVVQFNLMQQDAVAMRMTMRLAYATVNPVTIMQPSQGITARWPFGAVLGVGTANPSGGAISVIQAPPYPYTGTYMADADQQAALEKEAAEEAEAAAKLRQAEQRELDKQAARQDEVQGRARGTRVAERRAQGREQQGREE